MSKIFSERLKYLREKNGDYQADLAEQFKVNRVTITNWESGRQEPSMDMICQIADYFDVTTDFLLGHDVQEIKLPSTGERKSV